MLDPRTELSDCYDITDEAVRQWQHEGLCLCGCGEAVKTSMPPGQKRRKSFFLTNHHWRVIDKSKRDFKKKEFCKSLSIYLADQTMKPVWVGTLVKEYLESHQGETLEDIAHTARLYPETLRKICRGSTKSIYKRTYVDIMDAIGEPLPTEWHQYRHSNYGTGRRRAA